MTKTRILSTLLPLGALLAVVVLVGLPDFRAAHGPTGLPRLFRVAPAHVQEVAP